MINFLLNLFKKIDKNVYTVYYSNTTNRLYLGIDMNGMKTIYTIDCCVPNDLEKIGEL